MNAPQHTPGLLFSPGPWTVEDDDMLQGCAFIPIEDANGLGVCEVQAQGDSPRDICDADRANARLIAAAPTLVDELHLASVALVEAAEVLAGAGMTSFASIIRNHASRCDAAIANATGAA